MNNSAARGVLVGNYVFPGGIDLNVYHPSVCWTGDNVGFDVEAHYYGMGFSDSLPVAGATVILADPIFQGLAIALMAGSLISMFTAPVLVPPM